MHEGNVERAFILDVTVLLPGKIPEVTEHVSLLTFKPKHQIETFWLDTKGRICIESSD